MSKLTEISLTGLEDGDYSADEVMEYVDNLVAEVESLKKDN